MKSIIYFILIFVSYSVIAESFSYLRKENLGYFEYKKLVEMNIHYNPDLFKKIGKKSGEFSKGHPLFTDEFGRDDVVLGIFDITGKGDNYYIVYSLGPSFDVNYCFHKESIVKKAIENAESYLKCDFVVYALSIVIPGNGNLYTYGHNNSMYDIRLKYTLKNNQLELVPQPFLYIGKNTKSLKDQVVYTDEKLETESFRITKDYEVTVVGFKHRSQNKEGTGDLYLVASEFGLLGWVPSDGWQKQSQFDGFYFNGD